MAENAEPSLSNGETMRGECGMVWHDTAAPTGPSARIGLVMKDWAAAREEVRPPISWLSIATGGLVGAHGLEPWTR